MAKPRRSDKQILRGIAARIREARIRYGTQERIAEALDVIPETIRRWESGRSWPSIQTMHRLSSVLSVEFAWLLGVDPPGLRKGEEELLRIWRGLSDEQRLAWKVLMRGQGRTS